jgi:hypothetical protein
VTHFLRDDNRLGYGAGQTLPVRLRELCPAWHEPVLRLAQVAANSPIGPTPPDLGAGLTLRVFEGPDPDIHKAALST